MSGGDGAFESLRRTASAALGLEGGVAPPGAAEDASEGATSEPVLEMEAVASLHDEPAAAAAAPRAPPQPQSRSGPSAASGEAHTPPRAPSSGALSGGATMTSSASRPDLQGGTLRPRGRGGDTTAAQQPPPPPPLDVTSPQAAHAALPPPSPGGASPLPPLPRRASSDAFQIATLLRSRSSPAIEAEDAALAATRKQLFPGDTGGGGGGGGGGDTQHGLPPSGASSAALPPLPPAALERRVSLGAGPHGAAAPGGGGAPPGGVSVVSMAAQGGRPEAHEQTESQRVKEALNTRGCMPQWGHNVRLPPPKTHHPNVFRSKRCLVLTRSLFFPSRSRSRAARRRRARARRRPRPPA